MSLPNWKCPLLPIAVWALTYSSMLRVSVLLLCMQRRLPAVISGRPRLRVTCSRLVWRWVLTLRLRLTSLIQKPLRFRTLWKLVVVVIVWLHRLVCNYTPILLSGYLAAVTRFPLHWLSSLWLNSGPWQHFLTSVTSDNWNRPRTFLAALVSIATRAQVRPFPTAGALLLFILLLGMPLKLHGVWAR